MRSLLIASIIILIIPTLVHAKKNISLFNKNNLSGWYAYNTTAGKQKDASQLFSVSENMIRLYGKEAGYLMSKKTFEEFKLTAVFRWNTDEKFERKNNKKNSGLMYLVPTTTPDELWPAGIQFQIKEGATGDFVLLKNVIITKKDTPITRGKSVVVKADANAEKLIGEWNTLIVTVNNGTVTQTLNGTIVNIGNNPSVTKGRILLQYEGFPIDFKDILIEKL